jgi:hypothetical protein
LRRRFMKRIARGGEAVRWSAEESQDLRIALDRLRDEDDEIVTSAGMKKMLASGIEVRHIDKKRS